MTTQERNKLCLVLQLLDAAGGPGAFVRTKDAEIFDQARESLRDVLREDTGSKLVAQSQGSIRSKLEDEDGLEIEVGIHERRDKLPGVEGSSISFKVAAVDREDFEIGGACEIEIYCRG